MVADYDTHVPGALFSFYRVEGIVTPPSVYDYLTSRWFDDYVEAARYAESCSPSYHARVVHCTQRVVITKD